VNVHPSYEPDDNAIGQTLNDIVGLGVASNVTCGVDVVDDVPIGVIDDDIVGVAGVGGTQSTQLNEI
jgi:hypothetical protein